MKKLYMLMFAAAVALMTGCVATPVPPMDTRVTIAPDLGHKLYVTDVRCTKGHSDFLTLQVNAVNNTGSELRVQWKVVWLDGEGMEIDSLVSSWNSLALQPHEIRGLKGTAPRVDAADMRFYARKMP
jgi:uncharacterized protein YcfL